MQRIYIPWQDTHYILLNEKSQSGKVTYNIIQAYKGDKNNRELNTHTGEDKEKTWEI